MELHGLVEIGGVRGSFEHHKLGIGQHPSELFTIRYRQYAVELSPEDERWNAYLLQIPLITFDTPSAALR